MVFCFPRGFPPLFFRVFRIEPMLRSNGDDGGTVVIVVVFVALVAVVVIQNQHFL